MPSHGCQSTFSSEEEAHVADLVAQGRLDDVIEFCHAACQSDPDNIQAWSVLGLIYGRRGNFAESEKCFRQMVSLAPHQHEQYINLGNVLRLQGRLREAEENYLAALDRNPELFEAKLNLANLYSAAGRYPEAADYYEKIVGDKRARRSAFLSLGIAYEEIGQDTKAGETYQRALRLWPRESRFYYRLAFLRFHMGQPDQSIKLLRKGISLKPDNPEAHALLAQALTTMGLMQDAESHIAKAIDIAPENISLRARAAMINEVVGNHENAMNMIQPYLESGTVDVDIALAYGTCCRHFKRCEDAAHRIEDVLSSPRHLATRKQRCALLFRLGEIYDSLGHYAQAFPSFREGNRLSSQPRFNRKKFATKVSDIISIFDKEYFRKAARASNTDQRPIFIVGMPRSGTSLTEQILASHPQVYGAGELKHLSQILFTWPERSGTTVPYPQYFSTITTAQLDSLANNYLDPLRPEIDSVTRFTDKMPQNFLLLGCIFLLFPKARLIHCRRDPLDTCLSCYFQNFSYSTHNYSYSIEDLAAYYSQYLRIMEHWRTVLDVDLLEIDYEYIVNRQEEATRLLLDHCGLPWDERCLHFFESKRHVSTASYDQVRRPLYQSSVGRWKNYQQFIGPLIDALHASSAE